MQFLHCPAEVIGEVFHHLDDVDDYRNLAFANKTLYKIAQLEWEATQKLAVWR